MRTTTEEAKREAGRGAGTGNKAQQKKGRADLYLNLSNRCVTHGAHLGALLSPGQALSSYLRPKLKVLQQPLMLSFNSIYRQLEISTNLLYKNYFPLSFLTENARLYWKKKKLQLLTENFYFFNDVNIFQPKVLVFFFLENSISTQKEHYDRICKWLLLIYTTENKNCNLKNATFCAFLKTRISLLELSS